jgi:hypothetical protein
MFSIPKKLIERATASLKNYQKIAESHRIRDVSEADTVTLVKDILADVFGFDKYSELTSEQQIRGTFCDLAVKIDSKIRYLIEVKAAGVNLNDSHIRQAINYAVHQGVEWVILTNAVQWRLYRIKFGQPVDAEEVVSIDFLTLGTRSDEDQRRIFLFSREGLSTDAMNLYHQHASILNPYTVAQVLMQESVVSTLRREIRKLFPDIKVSVEELTQMMQKGVLKREVLEGDSVSAAAARIKKAGGKLAREAAKKASSASPEPVITTSVPADPVIDLSSPAAEEASDP